MRRSCRFLLALGLALTVEPAGGGLAADLPPLRGDTAPFFSADLAISLDAEDRPALSVSVSVPYSGLQWLLLAPGYGAGAEVMVSPRMFDVTAR